MKIKSPIDNKMLIIEKQGTNGIRIETYYGNVKGDYHAVSSIVVDYKELREKTKSSILRNKEKNSEGETK